MKYSVTGQQAFFFNKFGFIEFEQVLDEKEVQTLCMAAKNIKKRNLSHHFSEVQKILFSRSLAALASGLSSKRQLRFAFDQVIAQYPIKEGFTIGGISCIAPLAVCVMLCIDGTVDARPSAAEGMINPFATKAGNAIFFRPDAVWDPACMHAHDAQTHILLAYGEERQQYLFCLEDPYLHDLKKEGLVFGDRIPEKSHPILCR